MGAHNVATAAAAAGACLVQISTDYVFAGDATAPYPAGHPVAPVNAYGRTKAAGEWAVRSAYSSAYVVRTAWLYGEHGPNFVSTMLRLASERETVDVVNDQRGQPTWTRDLADGIVGLVDSGAPFGTLHGSAAGETTWYGFARAIFEESGLEGGRVRATTSDRFDRPARRPTYSTLGHSHLQLPGWRDALRRYLTRPAQSCPSLDFQNHALPRQRSRIQRVSHERSLRGGHYAVDSRQRLDGAGLPLHPRLGRARTSHRPYLPGKGHPCGMRSVRVGTGEHVEDHDGHDRRFPVHSEEISTKLGYEHAVPLVQGLTATVEWHQANRARRQRLKRWTAVSR